MRRFISSLALCLIATVSANAQIGTLTYDFSGTNTTTPSQSQTSTNTQYVDAGFAVLRSTGITPVAATNGFSSSGWTTTSTVDTTQYYQVKLSVAQSINVSQLTINAIFGAQGPTSLDLAYSTSLNGPYTTVSTLNSVTSGVNTFSGFLISDMPAQNNFFRIYGYNATGSSTDTFELSSVGTNAITLPFFPAPEPTSMIGLSFLGLSALGYKLRRKTAAAA